MLLHASTPSETEFLVEKTIFSFAQRILELLGPGAKIEYIGEKMNYETTKTYADRLIDEMLSSIQEDTINFSKEEQESHFTGIIRIGERVKRQLRISVPRTSIDRAAMFNIALNTVSSGIESLIHAFNISLEMIQKKDFEKSAFSDKLTGIANRESLESLNIFL